MLVLEGIDEVGVQENLAATVMKPTRAMGSSTNT